MTEAIAFGFTVVALTSGCSALVFWLTSMTKPRPVITPARQEFRRQREPLPTIEAELYGGPYDGAIVAIPAHQPDAVIHRGQWYRMDQEGIYRHDPTTHLTRRGY